MDTEDFLYGVYLFHLNVRLTSSVVILVNGSVIISIFVECLRRRYSTMFVDSLRFCYIV